MDDRQPGDNLLGNTLRGLREHVPESLDELLTYPDARELFHELVERYALRSGISGVHPKVLLAAAGRGTPASNS
jgi:serine/threonine-protein kinase HipA